MAERIEAFSVSVPAGTASSAPQLTALTIDPGEVERVEIFVPSGHAGLTGFALDLGQQQIIPYDGATFIVADSDTISWPMAKYGNSGQWRLRAYNTDVYAHSFYIRFLVNEIRDARQALPIVTPLAL